MLTLRGGDGWREMRETERGAREQEKGRTLVRHCWGLTDAISSNTNTTLRLIVHFIEEETEARKETHLSQVTISRW